MMCVRRLELLHRPILPVLQGVNQPRILHDDSLLFVRMSYYTPETAKSHKNFSTKFVSSKNACPLSVEGRQALDTKGWKLTHISGMLSAPGMREKHILYASTLFPAGNCYHGC